jgi:hypothetical protein
MNEIERRAAQRAWAHLAITCSGCLLFVAMVAENITLASQDYQGILRFAVYCDIAAVVLGVFAFVRGGRGDRFMAAFGIVPVLSVAWEFFRRYHF